MIKLRYVCIYHKKERSYKVAVCRYHHMFIKRYKPIKVRYEYIITERRKEVIKLRYVYIIRCSSNGKELQSCVMYIS